MDVEVFIMVDEEILPDGRIRRLTKRIYFCQSNSPILQVREESDKW